MLDVTTRINCVYKRNCQNIFTKLLRSKIVCLKHILILIKPRLHSNVFLFYKVRLFNQYRNIGLSVNSYNFTIIHTAFKGILYITTTVLHVYAFEITQLCGKTTIYKYELLQTIRIVK